MSPEITKLEAETRKVNDAKLEAAGWHEVVLEKNMPFESSKTLPVSLDGAHACPPEDVGGNHGYMMFLEAISDQSHPEHEDTLEWIGGDFDPGHFDLAEANDLLREYCD